jgi:hypothetical protein
MRLVDFVQLVNDAVHEFGNEQVYIEIDGEVYPLDEKTPLGMSGYGCFVVRADLT